MLTTLRKLRTSRYCSMGMALVVAAGAVWAHNVCLQSAAERSLRNGHSVVHIPLPLSYKRTVLRRPTLRLPLQYSSTHLVSGAAGQVSVTAVSQKEEHKQT